MYVGNYKHASSNGDLSLLGMLNYSKKGSSYWCSTFDYMLRVREKGSVIKRSRNQISLDRPSYFGTNSTGIFRHRGPEYNKSSCNQLAYQR
jgi:hypothetical protein